MRRQFGARAVAIVSPFYYKLSPESVYAYFREIALHSPIDVTLYNIPMFASPIDVPTRSSNGSSQSRTHPATWR